MWTKLIKSSFVLGISLIAAQSFAAVELSLEDVKKEVLNENIDVKIQYEKFYQAQKNVAVARGEFLPGASISLLNVNATLAILQSVIPTPSGWFVYQASKELEVAERYTTESIKLNILEALTINYINIKHQETLMKSLVVQEDFLNKVFLEAQKKEELGMASPSDVFMAKRDLMQHRQDMYALETLMLKEKQSILIALNKSPSEELILDDLPEITTELLPERVEEGIALALNNSPELVSNTYQAQAAQFMRASQRWSFVSFNGIGFDYGAKIAIEGSKARVIELQKEQITLKIKNQVHTAYHELDVLDKRIAIQEDVVRESKVIHRRNTELFNSNALPLKTYIESSKNVSSEERALVRLSMERLVKISQIKRLLGIDASLNSIEIDAGLVALKYDEVKVKRGYKQIRLSVDVDETIKNHIFSVTYSIPDFIEETKVTRRDLDFSFYFTGNRNATYTVRAKILLVNGDIIEKEEVISID